MISFILSKCGYNNNEGKADTRVGSIPSVWMFGVVVGVEVEEVEKIEVVE